MFYDLTNEHSQEQDDRLCDMQMKKINKQKS